MSTETGKGKGKRGRKPGSKNKPRPIGVNSITILEGHYGIDGNRIEFKPIMGKKLTAKMAGSDPAKGAAKTAIVQASVNGTTVVKTFVEGEVIIF